MMASRRVGRPMTALDEDVDGASSGFTRPPMMTSSQPRWLAEHDDIDEGNAEFQRRRGPTDAVSHRGSRASPQAPTVSTTPPSTPLAEVRRQ
jgi:hypothetical protein